MSESRKGLLSKTIFDWFNGPLREGEEQRPYSYNQFEDELTIGVDGELYCKDLAAFIDKALPQELSFHPITNSENYIKGTKGIGGTVQLAAADIDFNASYSFQATGPDGKLYRWLKVKPEKVGESAIFALAEQPL